MLEQAGLCASSGRTSGALRELGEDDGLRGSADSRPKFHLAELPYVNLLHGFSVETMACAVQIIANDSNPVPSLSHSQ